MDPSGFSGNDLPAADRLLSSWLGRLGRDVASDPVPPPSLAASAVCRRVLATSTGSGRAITRRLGCGRCRCCRRPIRRISIGRRSSRAGSTGVRRRGWLLRHA